MAIHLTSVSVRHERRIRLIFDVALAAGAFGTSAGSLYVITADGATPPYAIEAIALANTPTGVDLALDLDLVDGVVYTVHAFGVPGTDGTTADSTQTFAASQSTTPVNAELPPDDIGALVYGADIVWGGADFVEDDNGDLATIDGLANYEGALRRRLTQDVELSWAPNYGARPGEYVNGPSPLASTLRGSLLRQATADDRTKSASVTFAVDPSDETTMLFQVEIVPNGAPDGDQPVVITVPAG